MRPGHHGKIRGTIHAPGPCAVVVRWYTRDGRCRGRKRVYAGQFSVSAPMGSYFLEVTDERGAHDPARFTSATVAVVVRPGLVSEVEINLSRDTSHVPAARTEPFAAPAGVLQGRVVDAADATMPLPGALVRLTDEVGRLVARTRADAGGHFAFVGLATGYGLRVLVRPAPGVRGFTRLVRDGLTVVDDAWRDLGDLALPRVETARTVRGVRRPVAEFGSSAALSLPSTRV